MGSVDPESELDHPPAPAAEGGDALGRLLRDFDGRLRAYVAGHLPQSLRRHIEPQDVLQDTYIEAFRRLREFAARNPDPDAVYRWIQTIARTRLVNQIDRFRALKRGGGRVVGEPAGDPDGSMVALLQDLAEYRRTPSKSAMAHELAAALERSIDQLPPDYGRAIRLRYIERLAVVDVAAALRRTERAVHMVCNRALKALRRDMRSASLYI